jgi:hypothetical protein
VLEDILFLGEEAVPGSPFPLGGDSLCSFYSYSCEIQARKGIGKNWVSLRPPILCYNMSQRKVVTFRGSLRVRKFLSKLLSLGPTPRGGRHWKL